MTKITIKLISLILLLGSSYLIGERSLNALTNDRLKLEYFHETPVNNLKCTDQPLIANEMIAIGKILGVKFMRGRPLMEGKDATYKALHGRLGLITLSDRAMSEVVRCKLITHEFIHVLQHLNGDLKGVKPLGWVVPQGSLKRFGSAQEAEAYVYQNNAEIVLKLLLRALSIQQEAVN